MGVGCPAFFIWFAAVKLAAGDTQARLYSQVSSSSKSDIYVYISAQSSSKLAQDTYVVLSDFPTVAWHVQNIVSPGVGRLQHFSGGPHGLTGALFIGLYVLSASGT